MVGLGPELVRSTGMLGAGLLPTQSLIAQRELERRGLTQPALNELIQRIPQNTSAYERARIINDWTLKQSQLPPPVLKLPPRPKEEKRKKKPGEEGGTPAPTKPLLRIGLTS